MKVICVNYGHRVPWADKEKKYITEGAIYTVKKEVFGFSNYAERMVEAYEFYEIEGYYERGMFMPLSNIDEMSFDSLLKQCLKTKPLHKKNKFA